MTSTPCGTFGVLTERPACPAGEMPIAYRDEVHDGLYARAKANLENNTRTCLTLDEVKEFIQTQGGFAKTMWCGELDCELKMKEEAGVSSRCMPLVQEKVSDTCVCCGKPAKHMIYWGVAY